MKKILISTENRDSLHAEIQSCAITRALSRESKITPEELRKFAAELMISVSRACFEYGAKDIGHVKAHLKHKTGFLSADTLGSSADVRIEGRDGQPTEQFTLIINSVVYGLAGDKVRSATEDSLESVSSHFGLHEIKNEEKSTVKRKKR